MDEPDADELAWMACQQLPDEDEEFYNDVDDADNVQPRSRHSGPEDTTGQFPADEPSRKRSLSDATQHPLVKDVETSAKRVRSFHHVLSPSEVARIPASSPVLTTRVDLHGDTTKNNLVKSPPRPEAFRPSDYLPFRMASSIYGECMPVTGPSGDRVYTKLNQSGALGTKSRYNSASTTTGLLVQPIEVMLERADEERIQKMSDVPAGDSLEKMAGHLGGAHEQLWVEKYAPKSFTDLLSDEHTNRQVLHWLKQWDSCVFGHKTNSSTSEEVLVALRRKLISAEGRGSYKTYKQDHFGSRKMTRNGPSNNQSTSWTSKQGGISFKGIGSQTVDEIHEKVLLLCGPPGLGKTTLAHVAAKHCGYRIVEINASDDRVATTLQGKILDAVQMKSVTGDCRPNCLIIDEIDGAVGGAEGRSAITQLVDIIKATNRKNAATEETHPLDGPTKRAGKKKKTSIQSLARPIICICNDLYAPALRPLRQVARVHMFSRPSASRVVIRCIVFLASEDAERVLGLKHICKEEGFKANIGALTALAEHAESDIRACLNTLQFLKRKGKPLISVDVGSQVIGFKDMTRSAYDIWGEVFRKIETPSRLLVRSQTKPGVCGLAQDQLQFLRVYDLIANHGDHDLALNGIHENLLRAGYQDSSLSKTVHCLHAIGDSDIRNSQVYTKQRYFLNGYQPSSLIAIRSLIAAPVRPNIQWPRAFQRYKTELAGRREMLNSWCSRMSPAISRSISISPLTLDVVSPLLTILGPSLRPVAVQLYTNSEKETMKQLVDTMTCFGLTYKHDKVGNLGDDNTESNRHGQGQVHLDPPVNTMVNFEGYRTQHRQLSSTLCRILGHEVELERIRRESLSVIKSDPILAQRPSSLDPEHTSNEENVPHSRWFKPKHKREPEIKVKLQTDITQKGDLPSKIAVAVKDTPATVKDEASTPLIKTKIVQTVIHQRVSFFDGWKKKEPQSENEKKSATVLSNQRDLRPFLYKFHEGFTNAIRRPMIVREFF